MIEVIYFLMGMVVYHIFHLIKRDRIRKLIMESEDLYIDDEDLQELNDYIEQLNNKHK